MEINRINYEKFFLLYLDRELNPAEKQEVEKFLTDNTDLQKEFKQLQQTVLAPQEFVFEPKELLYRKEEKRKIIPFYRMQVAAAIAGLILGGWIIISVIVKNHQSDISGDYAAIAKNKVKDASSNDLAGKNDKMKKAQKASVHPDNSAGQTTGKTDAENPNAGRETTPDQKGNVKKQGGQNTLSQTGNQNVNTGKPNPSDNTVVGDNNPESGSVAIQKSSAGLEVQPGSVQADTKRMMVAGQPVKSAPVLAMAAAPNTNASDYENALRKDQEYQSDNAISVVALNDPNKGISRFFKKLTKRTPEETNARQIRVSVFQFSY
jgi:hypothetical protein